MAPMQDDEGHAEVQEAAAGAVEPEDDPIVEEANARVEVALSSLHCYTDWQDLSDGVPPQVLPTHAVFVLEDAPTSKPKVVRDKKST